ncbi:MAG: penicillin-binding protein 2 [Micavibrio aeruginosavorus]|uniref:Penicillin-binding protein 2 n=1 Tax=Micavibrio aeruginosavorus TaxID=349221 RepID=A0A7T5R212_9BACT|nr:MAG: penicillin-binding protein 2 [Micavibrio aeruginosavorus]
MDRDQARINTFSRRAFFVGGVQGILLTTLVGRLGWLQIAESQRYRMLAENNRINVKLVAPPRGLIVDRTGKLLAINDQNFRLVIIPEQTEKLDDTLRRLQKHIELTEKDVERLRKQAKKNTPFFPLEVRENLDWETVSRIEVNLPDLPGVAIDVGEVRSYPMAEATAHILGYVGAVSKGEENVDPLLRMPGFKIGKTGLEKTYDRELRGKAGTSEVEVNVVGREVRELRNTPAVTGKTLQLTIDAELQAFTQTRLLEQRSASAVIMDVRSGELYALASSPSFNPNEFAKGIPADLWEQLLADPGLPLNNKAVGGTYPPGSTFKLITALAALEAGIINEHTSTFCPGHYELGNARFHCWKRGGHGTVNLVRALAESCDTFFYKIAVDLGINRIADMAKRFGLAQKLDVELPEERVGLMPTTQWKKQTMKDIWHPGESIVCSIGQGYVQATPLQLAVMAARIVNGGYAVKPWLTGYIGDAPTHDQPWEKIGVKDKHLELVMKGMDHVVNYPGGTALGARITDEGMAMGGKTGTSQVKRITADERARGIKQEDLPWKFRHHGLFVGYAPVDNPRYVCAVVVEHGGGGSAVAAPIARDLLLQTQKLNPRSRGLRPVSQAKEPAASFPPRKPRKPAGEG